MAEMCAIYLMKVIDEIDIYLNSVDHYGILHDQYNFPSYEKLDARDATAYIHEVQQMCVTLPYTSFKIIEGRSPIHPCTYIFAKTVHAGMYTPYQILSLKRYIDYRNSLREYPTENSIRSIWVGSLDVPKSTIKIFNKIFEDMDLVIYYDGVPF